MKNKLQEWFEFHGAVLKRYPRPGYMMIFSSIIMVVVSWLYPMIIYKIAYFNIMGNTPYLEYMVRHGEYIKIGGWLIPFIVFAVLMLLSWEIHKKNVRKFMR